MLLLVLCLFAFAQTHEISGNSSYVEIENGTDISENITTALSYITTEKNLVLEKKAPNTNTNDTILDSTELTEDDTIKDDQNITYKKEISEPIEKVKVQFLYETGCPYSRRKYPELEEIVKELSPYIELRTNPFGNGELTLKDSELSISCQHGERECYGNRLHACAIDVLKDPLLYVPFNSCMMRYKKRTISNDASADTCGLRLNVTTAEIKSCAKNYRGFLLLVQYGIESEKIDYPGVPYWIINDVEESRRKNRRKTLMEAICGEIWRPPPVCRSSSSSSESDDD